MNKIASFAVDHTKLDKGVYVSRIDGDITTYDLRMRKPNTGDLISNSAMHSFEHMFATIIRNSNLSEKVIYFGPMGCQTGFYLLMRSVNHNENLELIKDVLGKIISYDGDMPGKSEVECGNYKNLDMFEAKDEARMFLENIRNINEDMLKYKV